MNKGAALNRLYFKTICMALTLAFGASIIVSGVMANSDCGMECCCLGKLSDRHHGMQDQIRSSVGCCAGSSQMPCDLASATELELPDISLAFSAGHISVGTGPTGTISDGLIDRHDFRGHAFDQFGRQKSPSLPLYLQNLSFLI